MAATPATASPGKPANAQPSTGLSASAAAQLAQSMQAAVQSVSPGSQVGIDVTDTTTGATLVGLNTDQQFYTASVVKLLIALDEFNGQGWQPDPEVADQTAADGTDQYFGIPDALTGDTWAIKQGWMTLDSSTTLDTTGLVGAGSGQPLRYAVVILTTQPADTSWTTGGTALTDAVNPLRPVLDPASS